MKISDYDRWYYIKSTSTWSLDGYITDDNGMIVSCRMLNRRNMFLPELVEMTPRKCCYVEKTSICRRSSVSYKLSCGHTIKRNVGECFYYCDQCGCEILW